MFRKFRGEWLAWVLLWWAARGLLLLSFADVFGYGEEPEVACAGKAIRDGLGLAHHQLAYRYFEGGGFVVSHLDALAFSLFGESLLAIKLVALAIGSAMLAVGWRLAERLGGRNAARVLALLLVFAPASAQKLSLLALGSHFQSLLFLALVLDAATQIIALRDQRPWTWLRLGLVAGFGLYFSYQLALTLAVCAVALATCLRGELLRKATWLGALGFAIGVSPLCWMAAQVGSDVFDIHGANVGVEVGAAKLDVLREFFASIFTQRSVLDWIGLVALCASPMLGFLALQASCPRSLRIGAWIVLAHIGLFLAAYLASGFTVGRVYHYFVLNRLMPLCWLAALFTALGAIAAWTSSVRWKQRLAGGLVAILALCGLVDLGRMVRDAVSVQTATPLASLPAVNLKRLASTRGYLYPVYLRAISPHIAGSSADKLRVFLRFHEPPGDQAFLHEGIAGGLYTDASKTLEEIQREIAGAGIADPRGFYLGLGLFLRATHSREIAARVHDVESEPPAVRDALIEAIGRMGIGMVATEDRVAREVELGLAANLPEAYFVGVGRRMVAVHGNLALPHYFDMTCGPWRLVRERGLDFARAQPAHVAAALLRGYQE
ncbi:MAG TPA: glycosyltransferase family 39 protein [Planctomycetota bacterium]|nr:glycosyltransferase family 39 protein [Planctomycetota bacterium]